MTLAEAQQAQQNQAHCIFHVDRANGWLEPNADYRVEITQVDTDADNPRIMAHTIEGVGVDINIAREDFDLLRLAE